MADIETLTLPPQGGETKVRVSAGMRYYIDYDPDALEPDLIDGALHLRALDGTLIILENFESAAQSGEPIFIMLQGGEMVRGDALIDQIRARDPNDGPQPIKTEGGPTPSESPSGGGNRYNDTLTDAFVGVQRAVDELELEPSVIRFERPPPSAVINVASTSDFFSSGNQEPVIEPVIANPDRARLEAPQGSQIPVRLVEDDLTSNDFGPGLAVSFIADDGLADSPLLVVPTVGFLTVDVPFGTLRVSADGRFSFEAQADLPARVLLAQTFTYVLTGNNGLSSSTTLSIDFSPDAVDDGAPDPDDEASLLIETGAPDGSFVPSSFRLNLLENDILGSSPLLALAVVDVAFTGDYVAAVNRSVTADGFLFESADGVWTFSLDAATGEGLFSLLGPYDHSAPGDDVFATQSFAYTIEDEAEERDSATITIGIKDDRPVAVADIAPLGPGVAELSASLFVNDDLGADGARVTLVEGEAVLEGQVTVVRGQFGTLEVEADGSYRYFLDPSAPSRTQLAESFVYRITDGDGDTATATLTIDIQPDAVDDGAPDPGDPATLVVEEAAPNGDFLDPPPRLAGNALDNDLFGSDPLTDPPIVAVAYTGSYAPGGVTVAVVQSVTPDGFRFDSADGVWSFEIDTLTGAYLFTLAKAYDHGADADEVLALQTFDYTIEDASGDRDTATITIGILDDTPVALADLDSLGPSESMTSGDLLANDDQGADGALVTRVGDTDIGALGTDVTGQFGTLTIGSDGGYVYELGPNRPSETTDETFAYSLTDGDGDSATATLTITIEVAPAPGAVELLLLSGPLGSAGDVEALRYENLVDDREEALVVSGRESNAIGMTTTIAHPAFEASLGSGLSPQEFGHKVHVDVS